VATLVKQKIKAQSTLRNMRYRCHTTSSSNYHRYGAKGIRVCKRWRKSFKYFLKDMGLPPTLKHSIDRIDGAKGYSKSNCRWATSEEQSANIKTNKLYSFNGKTLNERAWARATGLHRSTIRSRIRMGWSIERVLSVKPWAEFKGELCRSQTKK